jgi:hypothetical protein
VVAPRRDSAWYTASHIAASSGPVWASMCYGYPPPGPSSVVHSTQSSPGSVLRQGKQTQELVLVMCCVIVHLFRLYHAS